MTLRRDAFPASPVNARLSRALRLRIAFTMLSCLIVGVFSLKIDLLNHFQGSYQQFYSVPCPLNNASLANIADYPYVLGGELAEIYQAVLA